MNETVSSSGLQVKASGGIRDKETAIAMLDAGAERLGTSSGVKIVEQKIYKIFIIIPCYNVVTRKGTISNG